MYVVGMSAPYNFPPPQKQVYPEFVVWYRLDSEEEQAARQLNMMTMLLGMVVLVIILRRRRAGLNWEAQREALTKITAILQNLAEEL